jgi:hypothetical protein
MHAIIRDSRHAAQTRARFLARSEFASRTYARQRAFQGLESKTVS